GHRGGPGRVRRDHPSDHLARSRLSRRRRRPLRRRQHAGARPAHVDPPPPGARGRRRSAPQSVPGQGHQRLAREDRASRRGRVGRRDGDATRGGARLNTHVGTSGYNYPEWRGTFYPEKLPTSKMLAYYVERFTSVEINATFYRMPRAKTVEGWGGD